MGLSLARSTERKALYPHTLHILSKKTFTCLTRDKIREYYCHVIYLHCYFIASTPLEKYCRASKTKTELSSSETQYARPLFDANRVAFVSPFEVFFTNYLRIDLYLKVDDAIFIHFQNVVSATDIS